MRKVLLVRVVTALVVSPLAACGSGAVGQLGELHRVAGTCPQGKRMSAYVALSASGNQRGKRLTAARLQAVRSVAERVSVCGGGDLKVVAFGPSLASSATVYENQLSPAGATLNARLLRVPHLVNQAMSLIEKELPLALKRLTPTGGDPIGQLQAARDFVDEQGPAVQVEVLVETAGMAPQLRNVKLTPKTADLVAKQVDVPNLSDLASVTVAGLGRVGSGPHPSTAEVRALVAFYLGVCRRAEAVACRATSDIAVGG